MSSGLFPSAATAPISAATGARPAGGLLLSQADRPGGRPARLRRRPDPGRRALRKTRGSSPPRSLRLRRGCAFSPRCAQGLATPTHFCAADGGGSTASAMGGSWSTSVAGGDPKELGRRRHLSFARRPLRPCGRIPDRLSPTVGGRDGRLFRPPRASEGREAAVPHRAVPAAGSGSAAHPSRRSISPPIRSTST